jgi:hypothetical protein
VACTVVAATGGAPAVADTTPIAPTTSLPWTNPDHTSQLENLLGLIASHIAGRPVSMRCEGENDWTTLVIQSRGDPNAELGYVRGVTYDPTTGAVQTLPNFAELNGTKVCLPLQQFALATTKPTKCPTRIATAPTPVKVRVRVKRLVTVDGKTHVTTAWLTKTLIRPGRIVDGPPAPCYQGNENYTQAMTTAYWTNYSVVAQAILTIAHEAIHLSGVVGGRLRGGIYGGDPEAEAKANCEGMQWLPYVAEQLGDTPDDAQAIATYYWQLIYPLIQNSAYPGYWSSDCVPGGAMDIRPAGSTVWP